MAAVTPPRKRGAFCISIDLELAWGYWDTPNPAMFAKGRELERPIAARLLDLFERHEVSATWAIVGRLLEKPRGKESLPGGEGIWYAPDIIEKIAAAKAPQDIGSHSYAHIYFSECGAAAARADLEAARAIHARHSLPFSSFVFPRNQVGHLDELARAGIRIFRSTDLGWTQDVRSLNRTAGRAANLVDKILPIPPRTVSIAPRPDGMSELPSSMILLRRNGLRRFISDASLESKAGAGLRRAAELGEIFHLWFHPDNFYYRTDAQFEVLENILSCATDLRRRGELSISSMAALAAEI